MAISLQTNTIKKIGLGTNEVKKGSLSATEVFSPETVREYTFDVAAYGRINQIIKSSNEIVTKIEIKSVSRIMHNDSYFSVKNDVAPNKILYGVNIKAGYIIPQTQLNIVNDTALQNTDGTTTLRYANENNVAVTVKLEITYA